MSLRMASATKHPKTGTYRVRMAVPAHLRDAAAILYGRRAELIENLGTKDPRQAKALAASATARLQAMIAAAETAQKEGARRLSDKEVAALAGEFYRAEVSRHEDNPGDPVVWEVTADALIEQFDRHRADPVTAIDLSETDCGTAAGLLTEKGIRSDVDTLNRLGRAVWLAKVRAAQLLERRARGDWSPDENLAALPPPLPLSKPATLPASGATFDVLLTSWALDRGWSMGTKPVPRPLYDRQRTLERFAAFVGHRDAGAVTKADAVAFKEDMQRRGLHASTVRNDLSELSALWREGLRLGKLPPGENPFVGILPPKARKKGREPRAFTNAEAAAILTASRNEKGWRHWLPWVLCLTGGRLGEVCQAEKADVKETEGVWVLRIHDEGDGRSVKNADSRRAVPLHPALIAEGFLDYVKALPAGPLFPDIPADRIFGRRESNASRRFAYWLRNTLKLTDPLISPAHSFRHWWIGAARRVVMPVEVRSAITGHSAKADESAGYGDGMNTLIAVMAEWMARVEPPV